MYSAHTYGKHVVLRLLYLLKAFYPVLLHCVAIGAIVEGSALFNVPLIDIVAQQGLAMRCAYYYAARVGNCLGAWNLKEGNSTSVHAWPDGVGAEAQQKLEYLFVGLGTYLSEWRCHSRALLAYP